MGGRERRRKGPVNMIRRGIYGMLIMCGWAHGHAAETPKVPKMKPAAPRISWTSADEVAPVHAGAIRYFGNDEIPRNKHHSLLGDEPQLLTAHFNMDAANMIRSGIDVDLNLAGVATLRMKVAGDEGGSGRRFHMTAAKGDIRNPGRACSITGLVDVIAMSPDGDRKVVFIPQLNVALDTMLGAPGGMNAAVRYSFWTSGSETDKGIVGTRVPQLYVQWSF
jgi:hypothetical protein